MGNNNKNNMVFLLNLNLKENKSIFVSLRLCYGISRKIALCIFSKFGLNKSVVYKLIPEFIRLQIEFNLDKYIENVLKLKFGKILRYVKDNFYQKLINLRIYRSLRHRQYLPVRGQRTHTNAKTQKKKLKNRLKILKVKIKK